MDNKYLKHEIMCRVKPIISSWDVSDIYAISLWVNDNCDNPCEPTVTLGYNTESQCHEASKRASSKEEARWNYAFWLQNDELIFGGDETKDIVRDWIVSNGMPYIPCINYDWDWPDDVPLSLLRRITDEFVNTLVDIVTELHETGFIQNKFGKSIPLIIHELEYYHKIAQQNKKANPNDAIAAFVNWIEGLYH